MYLNLSYPITKQDVVIEAGIEPPEVMPRSRISLGKHSNTSYFKMFAHTGTHIDAPWHFLDNGKKVQDLVLEDFIFSKVCILDIPAAAGSPIPAGVIREFDNGLQDCDCLLVRTRFSMQRSTRPEIYLSGNPGFSVEAGQYLASLPYLRCLGMDLPSVENVPNGRLTNFPVHHTLLGNEKPMLLLEDANLAVLEEHTIKRLFLVPLMIEGIEAAPVTAVAEIDS
jgi:kynurenine formamidase